MDKTTTPMKTPSLKSIAAAIGASVPRSGSIRAINNGINLLCFTGASWRRRQAKSIRVWPNVLTGQAVTINAIVREARRVSVECEMPVTAEFRRLVFTVTPDGKISRNGRAFSGPRRPLP